MPHTHTISFTEAQLIEDISKWIPSKGGYKGIMRRALGEGWDRDSVNRVIAQEWAHVQWSSHWVRKEHTMPHTHTIPFTILHDLGIEAEDNLFDGNDDMLVDCFTPSDLAHLLNRADQVMANLSETGKPEDRILITLIYDYSRRLQYAIDKQIRKGY